ncbi:hypothetical protein POM88_002666 [Heracleum sosnowskyi]|uniref:PB1 domain-containing protein n=1 Tax=Heracleum sosnowskyi TaxID=360622 RepID=A0AAD8JI35_9APIA|nr:hypothetical protein POM88_002666 [Heracleum sosnowskyi]
MKNRSQGIFLARACPISKHTVVAHTSQNMNKINVNASYNGVAIRFELLHSSRMAELEDNVIERLKIRRDSFSIKYQDDEGDWVLIAYDKDAEMYRNFKIIEKNNN